VKYSAFRADVGDYDVFECAAERRGLADDMPLVKLNRRSPIGVASTSIGRMAPGRTTLLGRSQVPQGSIMPLSRDGLVALGDSGWALSSLPWWGWALGGIAAGWYLKGASK